MENPYAAPVSDIGSAADFSGVSEAADSEGKKFGVRAAAYVVDIIAFYAINFVVALVVGFVFGVILALQGRLFDQQSVREPGLLSGIVLGVLYFVVFEGLHGATPAKLMMGMRVVWLLSSGIRGG